MHPILRLSITGTIALFPALAMAQSAASYPSKPVRVVVSTAPGGGTDIQARLFSTKISENLQKQFLVENRTGAGITIGTSFVMKSPPDGYTLLASTPGLTFAAVTDKNVDYDPLRDFTAISLVTRAPYLLVVNASVPVTTVREWIAYAKANPGKLNSGMVQGTLTHIAAAWLNEAAGMDVALIPYKGNGPVLLDLTGGRLQAGFGNPLSTLVHVKSGKLRALATSMNRRSMVLPDLPTVAEASGIADYDVNTWHGWLGPAGVPPAITGKLAAELKRAVNDPRINEQLKDDGGEPVGSTPEEFRQLLAAEMVRWRNVVAKTRFSMD